MECIFQKVTAIRIKTIKGELSGVKWSRIIVVNHEGEHEINCFSENEMTVPISLHVEDEDDG